MLFEIGILPSWMTLNFCLNYRLALKIRFAQTVVKMQVTSQLIEAASIISSPEDYFKGLDWGKEILPRNVVCFCRQKQDHRVAGWDGISVKAGRYDQHSRYVLLVALKGTGEMNIETTSRKIGEGEAHLLFPHQVHYYMNLPQQFTWLYITFNLEDEIKNELFSWKVGGRKLTEPAQSHILTFLLYYKQKNSLKASASIGRFFKEMNAVESSEALCEPDVDLISRVKSYVMENLSSDLAMPILAKEMDVSESYLRAIFRSEAGVSLGNFVRSARLVEATHLLEKDKLDLGAISERTGFGSLTSFTRAFKRMYDMTPSLYRKQSRKTL